MTTGHGVPHPRKSRIANSMGKARILMEALPYIQAFRGRTVVVKYGGSTMDDGSLHSSFAGDVTLLAMVGIRPVIVHGGGPQISGEMERAGVKASFVDGLRVTDEATIRIVQRVLAGDINPDIVRLLNRHGCPAVGLTGLDAGLFAAVPKDPRLGFVGEVAAVNVALISDLLEDGLVPVIAPLGRGEDGEVYNLNADIAAGALARALGAQKLVYLTDVEGVRRNREEPESLISRMNVADLEEMLAGDAIEGGMRPKLISCAEALASGVAQAHILDGRMQHALLLEIFTPEGIGTMVTP
ncbi:MAG TPA: acetylglutamate kinase [Acidimicrobiia bacterium]|jgi:acetylglutamate kinase